MSINVICVRRVEEVFGDLPDPRKGLVTHKLTDLIITAIMATICKAETWVDIAIWAEAHLTELQDLGICKAGAPSHDTYSDVFRFLDPMAFNQRFINWTAGLLEPCKEIEVISLDGKTLRGSGDPEIDAKPIHLVNAFSTRARLTLGQMRADSHGGEIHAVLALLDLLEIKDAIITMDAASTFRPVAKKILEKGADYILAVKGNQPFLQDELDHLRQAMEASLSEAEWRQEGSFHTETVEKHGRIETRKTFAMTAPDYLEQVKSWPGASTIVFTTRTRVIKGESSTVCVSFISSLPPEAETVAHATRAHWSVESLHWHLDVTYREDLSQVTKNHGPENFSLLRKMAHNLLKTDTSTKHSVRGRQMKASGSWPFLGVVA